MSRARYGWFAASAIAALAFCLGAAAQHHGDNVVIILDGSGSMSEEMRSMPVTKLDAAKSALKQVLGQIPDTTQVGLLVFSSQRREPWVHPLGPHGTETLNQEIDSVRAGGGTPLGAFIKLGADRLLQQREEQFGYGSYRLLIVTDGQATDESAMRRFAPEVLARGITMDVIGVDMQQNHALAAMAHSYREADDSAALAQALAEVFAEVSAGDAMQGQDVDFSILDGIPVEIAVAMLESISKPINAPLGEVRTPVTRGATAASQLNPARQDRGSEPFPARPRSNGGGSFGWIVVVVAIAVVLSVARSRKGGRRR